LPRVVPFRWRFIGNVAKYHTKFVKYWARFSLLLLRFISLTDARQSSRTALRVMFERVLASLLRARVVCSLLTLYSDRIFSKLRLVTDRSK
jgi:hypothetical protein